MSKTKSIGKKLTPMAMAGMLLILASASLASQPQLADEPHGCSACEERLLASKISGDVSAIQELLRHRAIWPKGLTPRLAEGSSEANFRAEPRCYRQREP